ncbi:MAG TPA: anhydro-N-acetylmuramic acid kinase, partial [Candidatus Egerieousia sp.]|nr:anhydro-N-acetylmuramic acid kinase [Candidatus Egerieousia sp.]
MDFKKGIKLIGVMSGTSLDGIDFCYVRFRNIESDGTGKWSYEILKAEDESYPQELKNKLNTAQNFSALEYARLNSDYGLYLGARIRDFIKRSGATPDYIACHGQTIFHQPEIQFTGQIGSGAGIAAKTGVDTICDFRTTDVALGGQGAPLVPIGDRNLFGDYDYCLNLGGFSNISFESFKESAGGKRIATRTAFDISPVNYVLNYYMRTIGKDYDRDGALARSGKICRELLDRLNNLPFYTQMGPKSLGREWVENEVIPLMESYELPIEDKLCTFCEHAAIQTSGNVKGKEGSGISTVLVTGGGAFNKFLMERFQANAPQCKYVIPDAETVNFKEALIFA